MRKLHLLLSLPASASYGSELSLHLRHDRCSQGILFALRCSQVVEQEYRTFLLACIHRGREIVHLQLLHAIELQNVSR